MKFYNAYIFFFLLLALDLLCCFNAAKLYPEIFFDRYISSQSYTFSLFDIGFVSWILFSSFTKIYYVPRSARLLKVCFRIFYHFLFVFLVVYMSSAIFSTYSQPSPQLIRINLLLILTLCLYRALLFLTLRRLRSKYTNWQQRVWVKGSIQLASPLIDTLNKNTGFGYRVINDASSDINELISEKKIDLLFLPLNQMKNKENRQLMLNATLSNVKIKFYTEPQFSFKGVKPSYYGYTPVLRGRLSPLNIPLNDIIKKTFDFFFSFIVSLFFLTWFIPLMALIIKLDSKGPIFFIQSRPGLRGKPFNCLKFRSMDVNAQTEISAEKNDTRVTWVGKFIRKSSIDELPQFINVLFGDMSVVGPRPNLWSQNEKYGKSIEGYSHRLCIKPGITGLAQVSGARGGIDTYHDMLHRVKYDIFYIQNWSFALDIKIIIRTVLNIFTGDDKAY